MAPRVVVRQAPGAASAVEAVPGARSVQRTWQAARPRAATSESAMSASSVPSEHRRAAAANGVGPSAAGDDRGSTPAGIDVDRLIEAIEERVMAEIERRGGRYTGLF
jgi:hypothetical protein